MLTQFKPIAEKTLNPVASLLKNVNPNAITMLGCVFPVVFFACMMYQWYWAALAVFVLNGVDMLDGMVARMQGRVTAFGGFLDSTIDRFADFMVLVAFAFAGVASWNVVAPLVLLSFLISYIRSRTELAAHASGHKLVASVGIVERTERLVVVFTALLLFAIWPDVTLWGRNLAEIVLIVLSFFSLVTVFQRVMFAYKKL
jgi:archaetidylinositol phosphate synthase